jgi:NADPH:quinone reductase
MRAWKFDEFGKLENLKLVASPTPAPGPGEALVKLEFAALNPADHFLVLGKYPRPGTPPFSVGRDGCGVVEQPAPDSRFEKGDRVVVLRSDIGITRDGTLAEYVAVPEESLAPCPEQWTPEEGAAAPLVHLTAWRALVLQGDVDATKTVMVTGASGGVGTAAVQQAKALGARVVALSRSADKRAALAALGADVTVDSGAQDMEEQVKAALDGGRVDVVVENLAGPFLQKGLNLLAERGRIMVVGLLAGLKSEFVVGTVIFKQARIEGVQVGAYQPEESQEAWGQIVDTLDRAVMRPVVDRVFPMDQVQEAFAHLSSGPLGKVLIDVQA